MHKHIMRRAKFHDHKTSGSVEDSWRFLLYKSM